MKTKFIFRQFLHSTTILVKYSTKIPLGASLIYFLLAFEKAKFRAEEMLWFVRQSILFSIWSMCLCFKKIDRVVVQHREVLQTVFAGWKPEINSLIRVNPGSQHLV